MNILIIGGTRNVGHQLTLALLQANHAVTVFNRGVTHDGLPKDVRRLVGDRRDKARLKEIFAGISYDIVIDTALYHGTDAQTITQLLNGKVGHYIFLSTGQVYLVRDQKLPHPYTETAYAGAVMPAPPPHTYDHEEWLYGVEKRDAEDVLTKAWQTENFPFTTLRLPMVNSERDHFHRIYNYLLRLQDGNPILIPAGAHLPLRHVYGLDVVKAIITIVETGLGKGRSYNISQDETVSIDEFLALLAKLSGYNLQIHRLETSVLEQHQLLPDCSPFSDPWMSILDNQRSKDELGMTYTPLVTYLKNLVDYYRTNPPPTPKAYLRRREEIALAAQSVTPLWKNTNGTS